MDNVRMAFLAQAVKEEIVQIKLFLNLQEFNLFTFSPPFKERCQVSVDTMEASDPRFRL